MKYFSEQSLDSSQNKNILVTKLNDTLDVKPYSWCSMNALPSDIRKIQNKPAIQIWRVVQDIACLLLKHGDIRLMPKTVWKVDNGSSVGEVDTSQS